MFWSEEQTIADWCEVWQELAVRIASCAHLGIATDSRGTERLYLS
jgi:hypothetical protein